MVIRLQMKCEFEIASIFFECLLHNCDNFSNKNEKQDVQLKSNNTLF